MACPHEEEGCPWDGSGTVADHLDVNCKYEECVRLEELVDQLRMYITQELKATLPANLAGEEESQEDDALDLNWFYGKIGRQESEDILKECSEDAFMIRVSTMLGYFALSKWEAKLQKFTHVLIAPVAAGYKLENSPDVAVYSSVPHLIRESPIGRGCQPCGLLTSRRPADPQAMNVPTASMPKASTGRNAVASKKNMKRAMTQAAQAAKAKKAEAAGTAQKPGAANAPKPSAPKAVPKPVYPAKAAASASSVVSTASVPIAGDGDDGEESIYGKMARPGVAQGAAVTSPNPPSLGLGPPPSLGLDGQEENTYGKAPAPPAASSDDSTYGKMATPSALGAPPSASYGKMATPAANVPASSSSGLGAPPPFSAAPVVTPLNADGQEENTYGKAPAPPAAASSEASSSLPAPQALGGAMSGQPAATTFPVTTSPGPMSTREHVVEEIMNTERDYANSLGLLTKHYVVPLQQEVRDSAVGSGKPTLSSEQIEAMFSNLSELLDTSYNLLNTLEALKRKLGETGGKYVVGDVFKEMANDFKIYTTYCCNHPKAVLTYQKVVASNNAFRELERRVSSLPEMQNMDLCGFLIKPVQRIMKYPLLLAELLKNTDEDNVEYPDIKEAQDKIAQVLDYINTRKQLFENRQLLEAVKASIEGWGTFDLVKETRRVESNHECKGGKKLESYKLFLFSDLLIVTKMGKKKRGVEQRFKNRIAMDKLRSVDVSDSKRFQNGIDIMDRDDEKAKVTFYFATPQAKTGFLTDVRRIAKAFFLENADQLAAEALARKYQQDFQFSQPSHETMRQREAESRASASSVATTRSGIVSMPPSAGNALGAQLQQLSGSGSFAEGPNLNSLSGSGSFGAPASELRLSSGLAGSESGSNTPASAPSIAQTPSPGSATPDDFYGRTPVTPALQQPAPSPGSATPDDFYGRTPVTPAMQQLPGSATPDDMYGRTPVSPALGAPLGAPPPLNTSVTVQQTGMELYGRTPAPALGAPDDMYGRTPVAPALGAPLGAPPPLNTSVTVQQPGTELYGRTPAQAGIENVDAAANEMYGKMPTPAPGTQMSPSVVVGNGAADAAANEMYGKMPTPAGSQVVPGQMLGQPPNAGGGLEYGRMPQPGLAQPQAVSTVPTVVPSADAGNQEYGKMPTPGIMPVGATPLQAPQSASSTLLPGQVSFPLSQLANQAMRPANIDLNMLERYLSPAEFEVTFGMTQAVFSTQPGWKQQQMKQSTGLVP